MIEHYLKHFANLRTDKNRNRYPAITGHRAPHKPFLLLSVMDLIAPWATTENFIEPTFELVDTFNTYYASIMPSGSKTSMAYPFSRLQTDGFWHRVVFWEASFACGDVQAAGSPRALHDLHAPLQ